MAWDWDTYFNSGSRPGPKHGKRATPSRPPHLRLVREMNWDAYFNSGGEPNPAPQGRSVPARLRAVHAAPGRQSAT